MGFRDFCSSVGSAISSGISTVSNFARECCSVVSSAVSNIGRALVSGAVKLLEISGKSFDLVCEVIKRIGVALGVIEDDEDIDELGAKAMEADKKPEDFEYVSDYIQYLKDEVQLDREKFEKANEKDKAARKAVGATIVAKGIEEKKDTNIPMDFWVEAARHKMKANEIDKVIEMFKEEKMENNFGDYLKGNLDYKTETKTGNMLVKMYKDLEPNLSIEEIEEKIMSMENKTQKGGDF